MGRRSQIRCHGDDSRFEVLAAFIYDTFGNSVKNIAGITGGQGIPSRLLAKRYNYKPEEIDPRSGITHLEALYTPDIATDYDLIVGLHPDAVTRPVAENAVYRPVVIVPCCNDWDKSRKLNPLAIVDEIAACYKANGVSCQRVTLGFQYPNVCLVSTPGAGRVSCWPLSGSRHFTHCKMHNIRFIPVFTKRAFFCDSRLPFLFCAKKIRKRTKYFVIHSLFILTFYEFGV